MLDRLRRHASSWLVKGVLTLIILTFIFFFGYTRIASRYQTEANYIAKIGAQGIPRRRFEATFQESLDRLREGLKGETIPTNLETILRQSVIDQLVSRELLVQYGERLGLSVSDDEVARTIRADQNLFPEGRFDIASYEERFLPYYRYRYGEEFEEMVARDLMVQKVQILLPAFFSPWQEELKSNLSPEEIFSLWVDDFRKEMPVEVFHR